MGEFNGADTPFLTQSLLLVSTMDFDGMRSYGRALEAISSDPTGQKVVATTQSSESPVRALTTEIYTEVLAP